ncbi:MAG: type III-A CRISPR-associated RAMP protein Csm4 [Halarcobacter sp.]
MKLYKLTIKPISNFATSLQGDTLFGQICWAIKNKYGEDKLEELLLEYDKNPFLIVSDGFPKGYLPKPNMPMKFLKENSKEKKNNSKKLWLKIKDLENGNYINAKNINNIEGRVDLNKKINVMKNSLNYLAFRTEKDRFSPFGIEEYPIKDFEFDIYFLLSKQFKKEKLLECMEFISEFGYGKKTSIGKGRFIFQKEDFEEISLKNETTTYMTLSSISLENLECEELYYSPLTKFGKNSSQVDNDNPFKKPILLAKNSTVIKYKFTKERFYDGKAIKGISSFEKAIHQGYSILFPLKEIK